MTKGNFKPTYEVNNSEECKRLEEMFNLFEEHCSPKFDGAGINIRLKLLDQHALIYPEIEEMPSLRFYSRSQLLPIEIPSIGRTVDTKLEKQTLKGDLYEIIVLHHINNNITLNIINVQNKGKSEQEVEKDLEEKTFEYQIYHKPKDSKE